MGQPALGEGGLREMRPGISVIANDDYCRNRFCGANSDNAPVETCWGGLRRVCFKPPEGMITLSPALIDC